MRPLTETEARAVAIVRAAGIPPLEDAHAFEPFETRAAEIEAVMRADVHNAQRSRLIEATARVLCEQCDMATLTPVERRRFEFAVLDAFGACGGLPDGFRHTVAQVFEAIARRCGAGVTNARSLAAMMARQDGMTRRTQKAAHTGGEAAND